MGLCNTCAYAITAVNPFLNESGFDTRFVNVYLPGTSDGMTESCWICQTFAEWLGFYEPSILQAWTQTSIHVKFYILSMGHINRKPPVSIFKIAVQPAEYTETESGCFCNLVLLSAQDLPPVAHPHPKTERSPWFDVSLVRNWLRKCQQSHCCCLRSNISWYPTRLLRICPDENTLKLVISSEESLTMPYVTLSHRWGDENYPTLKTTMIDQMKKDINVSNLPRVFQDAIEVVRCLGLQYLWIDSLCIIQDSKNESDWETESRLMDRVYGSALLNISATRSTDSSESLFQQTSWSSLLPHEVELPANGSSERYFYIEGDLWGDEVVFAPLNARAWVLQERFLAPRVLHFGSTQLAWECNGMEALEMFPDGLPSLSIFSTLRKVRLGKIAVGTSDNTWKTMLPGVWEEILQKYTACQITYAKDRLRALEGMANYLSKSIKDRYYGGMWESCLIKHLVWQCDDYNDLRNPDRSDNHTPDFSRAPSWSWASLNAPILFPKDIDGKIEMLFVEKLSMTHDLRPSYGTSVPHLHVQMIGKSVPLQLEWTEGLVSSFVLGGKKFKLEDLNYAVRNLAIEHSEQEVRKAQKSGNVFWVPIYTSHVSVNGIIVIKTRGISRYVRVGTAFFSLKSARRDDEVNESRKVAEAALASFNALERMTEQGSSVLRSMERMMTTEPGTLHLLRHLVNKESWRPIILC